VTDANIRLFFTLDSTPPSSPLWRGSLSTDYGDPLTLKRRLIHADGFRRGIQTETRGAS